MERIPEISIELQDNEWPMTYTDHDREIVRAIVVDDDRNYYSNFPHPKARKPATRQWETTKR